MEHLPKIGYLKNSDLKDPLESNESLASATFSSKTAYPCHVRYAFQSESTLYSCLNVK